MEIAMRHICSREYSSIYRIQCYRTNLLMSRARVSLPSLEHIRPRGRCFIVYSFHARFTPSTTMNSLSRGFRAGGISDYTRVRPKADRAMIARSLTLIVSYGIEASSLYCQD